MWGQTHHLVSLRVTFIVIAATTLTLCAAVSGDLPPIKKVNGEQLGEILLKQQNVLVMFSTAKLTNSSQIDAAFQAAGKELELKIPAVGVDCDVEKRLPRRHHVRHYPDIRIVRDGLQDLIFPGEPTDKDAIVAFVHSYFAPEFRIAPHEAEGLAEMLKRNRKRLRLVLVEYTDKQVDQFTKDFEDIRNLYHDLIVTILAPSAKEAGRVFRKPLKPGSIVAIPISDERRLSQEVFEPKTRADKIKSFLRTSTLPLIARYNARTKKVFEANKFKVLIYFHDDPEKLEEELRSVLESSALGTDDSGGLQVAVGWRTTEQADILSMGLGSSIPEAAIKDFGSGKVYPYPFLDMTFDAENLALFHNAVAEGKIPAYNPDNVSSRHLQEIQENEFEDALRLGRKVLIIDKKESGAQQIYKRLSSNSGLGETADFYFARETESLRNRTAIEAPSPAVALFVNGVVVRVLSSSETAGEVLRSFANAEIPLVAEQDQLQYWRERYQNVLIAISVAPEGDAATLMSEATPYCIGRAVFLRTTSQLVQTEFDLKMEASDILLMHPKDLRRKQPEVLRSTDSDRTSSIVFSSLWFVDSLDENSLKAMKFLYAPALLFFGEESELTKKAQERLYPTLIKWREKKQLLFLFASAQDFRLLAHQTGVTLPDTEIPLALYDFGSKYKVRWPTDNSVSSLEDIQGDDLDRLLSDWAEGRAEEFKHGVPPVALGTVHSLTEYSYEEFVSGASVSNDSPLVLRVTSPRSRVAAGNSAGFKAAAARYSHILFAEVDASVEDELLDKLNVQVVPCVLILDKKGRTFVNDAKSYDDIGDELLMRYTNSALDVTSTAVVRGDTTSRLRLAAVALTPKQREDFGSFVASLVQLMGPLISASHIEQANNLTAGKIYVQMPGDDQQWTPLKAEVGDYEKIQNVIRKHYAPSMLHIKNMKQLDALSRMQEKLAVFITDVKDKENLDLESTKLLSSAIERLRREEGIIFCYMDRATARGIDIRLGVDKSLAKFTILHSNSGSRFVYPPNAPLNKGLLESFISEYLDGKLAASQSSAALNPPEENGMNVRSTTVANALQKNLPTVVFMTVGAAEADTIQQARSLADKKPGMDVLVFDVNEGGLPDQYMPFGQRSYPCALTIGFQNDPQIVQKENLAELQDLSVPEKVEAETESSDGEKPSMEEDDDISAVTNEDDEPSEYYYDSDEYLEGKDDL